MATLPDCAELTEQVDRYPIQSFLLQRPAATLPAHVICAVAFRDRSLFSKMIFPLRREFKVKLGRKRERGDEKKRKIYGPQLESVVTRGQWHRFFHFCFVVASLPCAVHCNLLSFFRSAFLWPAFSPYFISACQERFLFGYSGNSAPFPFSLR